MEPATMLVRAFQVDIGRPAQIGPLFEYESVRRTRIEPDVENVVHLVPFIGVGDATLEEAFMRTLGEPGIGALGLECFCDALVDLRVIEEQAGRLVDKNRDGYTPGALARNHPVRSRFDHAAQTVLAG